MGGVWKNTAYSIQRGKKSCFFFCLETGPEISCIFQSPENPMGRGGGGVGGELSLDQISSYCTSIKILIRLFQYANMITFQSHDDSNLIF